MLPPDLDEPFELCGVEPVGAQLVPLAVALDLEPGLPQLGDVHLKRVCGTRWRPLTPDGVHEPFLRDRGAAREQERDEERPRLGSATERLPSDLERPKYPELHEALLVERSLRPF